MRGRRWVWNVARITFTAFCVVLVLRMIQFRDQARVGGGEWTEVREVRRLSGRIEVVWAGGRRSEHPAGEVEVRRGFLGLLARVDKAFFPALAVALLVPTFLMALRWWVLLRGFGLGASLSRVFLVSYAGMFFNNFLPGAVGGDIAKAVLAAAGEKRKAAVVGTVILDRLVGLAVMILLGAGCLTLFLGRIEDKRIAYLVYALAGGLVLAYLVYFNRPLRDWVKARVPFRDAMRELDGVMKDARERRELVALAALLSAAAQAGAILAAYGLARAMGIGDVGLWTFFVLEPVIFIVTAVPISAGGWGVQEGAYALLFGRLGGMDPNEAVALSILFKLSILLVSVPGGILFAAGAVKRPVPREASS